MKYREKSETIDAIQIPSLSKSNLRFELYNWLNIHKGDSECMYIGDKITIPISGKDIVASIGDWIIKKTNGEIIIITSTLFDSNYERVERKIPIMQAMETWNNRHIQFVTDSDIVWVEKEYKILIENKPNHKFGWTILLSDFLERMKNRDSVND